MFSLTNIRKNTFKTKHWSFNQSQNLMIEDVFLARRYIQNYWPKLTYFNPTDKDTLIGLPNPYLIPSRKNFKGFDFNEMYYWDSYFTIQAFLNSESNKDLVLGILDNLIFLFKKFQIIPNASRDYLTSHSQPPLLTSMIYDIYDHYSMSNQWLEQRIEVAKEEYVKVWTSQELPYYHQVYQGLSRYYDSNDSLAENESGWDKTIRFNRNCLNYLPIDLNCMLYKYERDFYRTALIFNNDYEANFWLSKSEQRASQINHLMWDRSSGLFYDYNFVDKKKASIRSLAAYFALWSGVANDFQAEKLKNNLLYFEHQGGLVTTDFLPEKYQNKNFLNFQWSYPNGWAPLHFIVVEGLKKYNYFEDANRIAMRWLKTNLAWFEQNDNFLEKYNVVNVTKQPAIGIYTSQIGFGWTNAVFERFCQDFIDF